MRRSTLTPAFVLCSAALLALLTAGAASAQVVGTLPTGGTTAIRTSGTEGASAPATLSPRPMAAPAAGWLTRQWWAATAPARAITSRVEWAATRRKSVR